MKIHPGRLVQFALALAALALDSYFTHPVEAASWITNSPMIIVRQNHTATLLPSGKLLVAGGYNGTNSVSSSEIYDPADGLWTSTGPMTTNRYYHTATLLPNGRVLVAGGKTASMGGTAAQRR